MSATGPFVDCETVTHTPVIGPSPVHLRRDIEIDVCHTCGGTVFDDCGNTEQDYRHTWRTHRVDAC